MSEFQDEPLLKNMNPAQRSAILHTDGPVLILAGAGSGKTRVITHRIAWLIRHHEVDPENILAVTFTNKAAKEMSERVMGLLSFASQGLWVTTFHSLGARVLRKHASLAGLDTNFSIYGPPEQKSMIKEILNYLNLDAKRYQPDAVLKTISGWKSEQLTPSEVLEKKQVDRNIVNIYDRYREELRAANAADLDDLLFLMVEMFSNHESVLKLYQERFRYILVDEYQDTNPAQYRIIRQLSGMHGNVCVVGDEDQSIYSWRGADITNILNFEKDYAGVGDGVKRFELNINYRCPRVCLEAANLLISNNTQRTKDKEKLIAFKGGEDFVPYYLAKDGQDEARNVVNEIKRLKDEGLPVTVDGKEEPTTYRHMVILYRTHRQSRAFEEEFIRQNLPYQIFGGLKFFERAEIKDVLAYLNLIYNPFDSISLFRILNVPKRGLGPAAMEKLRSFAENHGIKPLLALEGIDTVRSGVAKKFKDFYEFYMRMRALWESGCSVSDLTARIIDEIGYMDYLKAKDEPERVENVEELLNTIYEFEQSNPDPSLVRFLEKAALITSIDDFEEGSSAVTLMTLHNAKGLEFPYVFIVGMEEGLFPHKNSLDDPGRLEEERRLCYVGLTRAMDEMFLSGARFRFLYGEEQYQIPSRFLREIGDEFVLKM
jgi:DNA helicase-2/ATP-dependent DNA helicase PcrA